MARSRKIRKLIRLSQSILHAISLFFWLSAGAVVLVYFFWGHGEVPRGEVFKSILGGAVVLTVLLLVLLHLARRRLSSGVVGSRSEWPTREFSEELRESHGAYIFVGNSFKPYLNAFMQSYSPDASGKNKASLVLAPAEKWSDAALGREHLEVIQALKGLNVEFCTMKRPRSWWTHIFNNQDEENVAIVLGLNLPDGRCGTVLELERIPKRYSLFEHFLSEAREVYSLSNIKNPEIWTDDLKRLVSSENN